MRRLLRSFRSRLALTVVLSALVAGGIGLAIPAYARSRAEDALRERLPGTTVSIGSVHVGLAATTLESIVLHGSTIDVRIERVVLRATWLSLVREGTHAITAVSVEGGHADVDVALLARERDSDAGDDPSGAPAARTISLHGVDVTLRSGEVTLAAGRLAAASWDGTALSASGDALALGGDTVDHAEVEATRLDGVLRLSRVSLGHVVVSADTSDEEGPIARLRTALRVAEQGGSSDPAAPPEEGPDDTVAARLGALERRLAAGFSLSVDDLTVRRTVDGEPHDVVAALRASLHRSADRTYTTEGEGRPEGGGSLAWDLDVALATPSASGTVTLDRVALAAFVPFLPASIPFHEPERARVSGHLALTTESTDAIHAEGTVAVEDLALAHPRIAPDPVRHIAFAIHGAADVVPSDDRVTVSSLALTMGAAQATLGGTIEWADDHYLLEGRATLPTTRCDDAVHAIPRDLLGDMASFHLSGDLAASLAVHVDSRDLPHTTLQVRVADACTFTAWPASADTARFAGPFEHHVEEPDGTTFSMTTGPGTSTWTPISEISPFMVHAVLAHEDAGFFDHAGFAPWAIREALIRDLQAGRYVAGGSTITMQLVKNVFLHREKTLARKIQEVLLTWWIETQMDKERILELYLNVIEYGPDVYGIRNAAEHYFGREPADLSPAESAFLALILPNPPRFHEMYDDDEIPRSFRNRIASFVRICGTRGRYDEAAVAYGVAEAETLAFHHEDDPPPPPRTTEGAVAAIPQIQFFSTVPLARLSGEGSVDEDGGATGEDGEDDEGETFDDDGWDTTWGP